MAEPAITRTMSKSLDIPPLPKSKCERITADLIEEFTRDISFNVLGLPYRRISGGAYPPYFSQGEVHRLQTEWAARQDDVFLVFPAVPACKDLQSFAVALVEQCDVDAVDLNFPRWIDDAASCRGWEYVDAIDRWPARRCLTTRAPPWRFPSKSLKYRCPGSPMPHDGPVFLEHSSPLIAVFVADPRVMVMKELSNAMAMSHCAERMGKKLQSNINLLDLLDAMVGNDNADTSGIGLLGNSLRTALAWSKVEALCPDRVRLFFVEDFVMQPEVAMRGLAHFLQVNKLSSATDTLVEQAARLASAAAPSPVRSRPQQASDLASSSCIADLVVEFERQLALAPELVQIGWSKLVESWSNCANSRLVTYADIVLQHAKWDPPKWWVAHNAQLCRPCLYFPRGKCDSKNCAYCHGPGHPRPKRPTKSKRASRRRFDRTPSPDLSLSLEYSSAYRPSNSTEVWGDRTPSPERFWIPMGRL